MESNLNQIKLSEISLKDEWIVEQINKETGVTHCLGKIFVPPTLHLNNQQLEWIHDLCNYGPADYELHEIYEEGQCIYNGFKAIIAKQITYIPMKGIDHCNDDIFIRKHYDMDYGYWIHNSHRHSSDKWVYTTRKEFINYWKENSKVYEIIYLLDNNPRLLGVTHNVKGSFLEANYEVGHILLIKEQKYLITHVDKTLDKIYYLLNTYKL